MQRAIPLATLLALTACGGPQDFVGDDLGDPMTLQQPATFGSDLAVDTPEDSCLATPTGEEVLTLTGGAGSIEVEHSGWVGYDCADWEITYSTDEVAGEIVVHYENLASGTCADTCEWAFAYTLSGVTPGSWTVLAGSESEPVTVQ